MKQVVIALLFISTVILLPFAAFAAGGPPQASVDPPAKAAAPPQSSAGAPPQQAPQPQAAPGTSVQAPAESAPLKLDLAKSVELAIRNSPTLAQQAALIRQAEGKLMEVQTGRRPTLGFDAGYTRIEPQVTFAFGDMLVQVVQANNWNAKLTFNYLISDFGLLGRNEDAMRYNIEAALRQYDAARNTLIYQVKEAYYTVLKTGGLVLVARDFLESANAHLKTANDRLKAGTVARFDVLRAEANMEDARQQLVIAENNFDLAKKSLLNIINLDLATQAELTITTDEFPGSLDLQDGSASALAWRPELKQLALLIDMGKDLVEVAKMDKNARLSFFSTYNRANATAFVSDSQWSTGVALNVPLFDAGKSKAKTVQAVGSLDQMKATYDDARRNILLEVNQAFLYHREAVNSLEVTKKRVASSGEAKKVADIRYRAGVSTNVEALDAQADFARAQAANVNALFDCGIAGARWDNATAAALIPKKSGK